MSRVEFFSKIENKYNITFKKDRGIILRFDARNITKRFDINLLDENRGFTYALKTACKNLSKKYPFMMIYVAVDEVNILIENSNKLLSLMKSNYAQEITAVIGQELSYLFHQNYNEFTWFAGRTFSVYKDNFISYLIYRKHTNVSVLTTYFCKRNNIILYKKNYLELHQEALEYPEYVNRTNYQKEGIIYLRGKEFTIEDIIKSSMQIKLQTNVNNNIVLDNEI